MDLYIFTAYFYDGTKQKISVNANSRFTAYAKATAKAIGIKNDLDLVELEKITFKF
jgi:hypothetical protein